MKLRILALLLALVMCLSACGSTAASSASASGSSASSSEEIEYVVPDEAEEDVVAYLTDGAYTKDSVVATVGDTEITAAQVLYWIAYQQYNLNYYYYYNYGYILDMTQDYGDGTTVGETLYQFGLDTALAYAVGNQKAQDLGLTLSEEDATALATLTEDNIAYYGEIRWEAYVEAGLINEEDYTEEEKAEWMVTEGTRFYNHSMMFYSTTMDAYAELINDYYNFALVQEQIFGEGGEYEITEDVVNAHLDSLIEENGLCWARCILFSTMDLEEGTDASEIKAAAEEAYATLSALEGDALSDKFTVLQTQYDESGYTAGEVQYYTNSDSLVDGYYDGILALEPGQISMVETAYGYFILLREEDNRDDIYDSAADDYMSVKYDELIAQWSEDYGVTEISLSDLDLTAYFDKLATLQDALAVVDVVE